MSRKTLAGILIGDIARVARDLGRTPTREEYLRLGKHTEDQINLAFSSWNMGLRAAGFKPIEPEVKEPLKTPKILIYDIETCQMHAKIWSPYADYVRHDRVTKTRAVIAWAAKWYKEEKIFYQDQRKVRDIRDDKALLEGLYKLIDEADVVITKNGKKFDQKIVYSRFAINKINGGKPPSPVVHEDIEQLFRKHFNLPYYSLEYLAETFKTKYRKLSHKKFPGNELWDQCERGNIEAWKEMEKYNRQDVLVTEELRDIIAPWGSGVNLNLFHSDPEYRCSCGGVKFHKRGFTMTLSGRFQKFQCQGCGSWHKAKGAENNHMSEKKKRSLKTPKW